MEKDNLEIKEINNELEKLTIVKKKKQHWKAQLINLSQSISKRVGHSLVSLQSPRKLYILGGASKYKAAKDVWEIDMNNSFLAEEGDKTTLTTPTKTPTTPTTTSATALKLPIIEFPAIYEFLAIPFPLQENNTREKVWIFGGATNQCSRNESYCFDPDLVTVQPVKFENDDDKYPSPRTQGGTKGLIELNDMKFIAVFGGGIQGQAPVNDAHLYLMNLSTKTWSTVNACGYCPNPRQGHVLIAIGSKVFVHGGMNGTLLFADLYMIDLTNHEDKCTWQLIRTSRKAPIARAAHNVTSIGNKLYIFGGMDAGGEVLNDLWCLNTDTMQWKEIHYRGYEIPGRLDFAFTSVVHNSYEESYLLIHGGMTTDGIFYDDLICVKPTTTKARKSQTPELKADQVVVNELNELQANQIVEELKSDQAAAIELKTNQAVEEILTAN